MNYLISTRARRLGWTLVAFTLAVGVALWLTWVTTSATQTSLTRGEIMTRFLAIPALAALATLSLMTACASKSAYTTQTPSVATSAKSAKPFMAQVVGVQWLNPLQRRDYSTEWQLLWTLGQVQPNKNDDMVRLKPKKYSTLQPINIIAYGNEGEETFKGFHHKFVDALIGPFHDIYFSSSDYFYNAHSLKDKTTWRELAGIRVEYALPHGKLDFKEATDYTRTFITDNFAIGNTHFPTAWTRNTPPDVRITMGGPNAGFTSLAAALPYLQANPSETVWAMNWDAPSFPPKDEQLNENMVLLVLAGPNYKTDRAALAWIGQPSTTSVEQFENKKGLPPATVQAVTAALENATANAHKRIDDIGYVIHDANLTHPNSSERIARLAHALTLELPGLDYDKQTFNTPALLGEMGAGTALTNVALGIAYANHFGKNVLVAGVSDPARPTAVLVVPPAVVRPIDPDKPWFRARGGNHAYLMWWGIRHDAKMRIQGYSD